MGCPKCITSKYSIKAGLSRGKQRFKCKECGTHYTTSDRYTSQGKGKHRYDFLFKKLICRKYEEGKDKGVSLRSLVKLYNKKFFFEDRLTHSTVLHWMKKYEAYKEEVKSKGFGTPF
jgi:hypothetical protein